MEFEERKIQLELERLEFERETDQSPEEGEEANQAEGTRIVFGEARFSDLLHFLIKKIT